MTATLQELGATPELTSLHPHTSHNALPHTAPQHMTATLQELGATAKLI